MIYHQPLEEVVKYMRALGETLIPYNYPKAPAEWEDDISILKINDVWVDGYNVGVHYSKADYGDHYLITLQVWSKNSPFLPFNLVCKVARKFVGEDSLALVEFFRNSRKIYCWTQTLDLDSQPCPNPQQGDSVEFRVYDGLAFAHVDPSNMKFH